MKIYGIKMIMDVCDKFGCEFVEIFTSRRCQKVADAKKVIYLVLRKAGYSLPQIGQMLKKDHTTILRVLRKIPDKLVDCAGEIFDKYQKEVDADEQALTAELENITNLLNNGLTLKEVARELKLPYDEVNRLCSMYVHEEKNIDYSIGCTKMKFFYKIVKKTIDNYFN